MLQPPAKAPAHGALHKSRTAQRVYFSRARRSEPRHQPAEERRDAFFTQRLCCDGARPLQYVEGERAALEPNFNRMSKGARRGPALLPKRGRPTLRLPLALVRRRPPALMRRLNAYPLARGVLFGHA